MRRLYRLTEDVRFEPPTAWSVQARSAFASQDSGAFTAGPGELVILPATGALNSIMPFPRCREVFRRVHFLFLDRADETFGVAVLPGRAPVGYADSNLSIVQDPGVSRGRVLDLL